jgi:phytanoyl-CoA hydroxylase
MSLPTVELPAESTPADNDFTPAEVEQFQRDGYAIVRGLCDESLRSRMLAATRDGLARFVPPIEYEADLQYPGAPVAADAAGGRTVRRLKQAHSRDMAFTEWAMHAGLVQRLRQLLGPDLVMPLAHHNCVMTKHPKFSSETGWHQDVRYWSFERPELISVWLALGNERPENGCLQLIPGTHCMEFDRSQLDESQFLRADLPENAPLLDGRIYAELEPGDVLFFHCRTFHAADQNNSETPKFSAVLTYRPADNPPLPNSRSSSLPELVIPAG